MSLKEALGVQRNYFKEYGQEISRRNLKLMETVCFAGITLFVFYYIITFLFFPAQMISPFYGLMIPILGVFYFEIRRSLKRENFLFPHTQLLTVLMHCTVTIYAILMSTVPHPELQAVYYPLFLLLGPVMFILPVYQQLLINGISYGFFCAAVVWMKPQPLWMHDLFESFTALVFSVIMILLMTQLRVQGEGLKDKYYQLSRKDGLTGLLNKVTGTALATDYVEDEILQETFALIILDIDDFKNVNDTYGHEKGDEILAYVGYLLGSTFRKEDIVCRFGGDEFMILMKNMTRKNTENKILELEKTIREIDSDANFTCSIGMCMEHCGKQKFNEVLKCADDALYQAKEQGKNQHFWGEMK